MGFPKGRVPLAGVRGQRPRESLRPRLPAPRRLRRALFVVLRRRDACGILIRIQNTGGQVNRVYVSFNIPPYIGVEDEYVLQVIKNHKICGDGEMQEGQVWEGVMFAFQQKLSRLVLFVDFNRRQLDGKVEDICSMENLDARLSAFGFYTQRVDGHDVEAIYRAVEAAQRHDCGPSAIVLETEKGHGCGLSEGAAFNHYMSVSLEQAEEAKRDIWARCLAAIGEV